MVFFGLTRCDEQEYDLEDSESPNQDFDDYSSITSSDSKNLSDDEDADFQETRIRPYPIDLKQLTAVPTDALAGIPMSDLFQITVTIPPAGSELLNQLDLSNIEVLPPADSPLDLDGLTSLLPLPV